jgi:glucokinase
MAKIVGLDLGGNCVNVTAYDGHLFHIDGLCEVPSLVRQGPDVCLLQLSRAFDRALEVTGWRKEDIDAVGLGSPGPVSNDGVLCAAGATNFGPLGYENFPLRSTLESDLGKPVSFLNDGNAAGLYAHWKAFQDDSTKTSISLIVVTGLGGGVVVGGRVLVGKVGFAAELGNVGLPSDWNKE